MYIIWNVLFFLYFTGSLECCADNNIIQSLSRLGAALQIASLLSTSHHCCVYCTQDRRMVRIVHFVELSRAKGYSSCKPKKCPKSYRTWVPPHLLIKKKSSICWERLDVAACSSVRRLFFFFDISSKNHVIIFYYPDFLYVYIILWISSYLKLRQH